MSDSSLRPLPDIERALGWITAGFNLLYVLTASAGFVAFLASSRGAGAVVVTLLVAVPVVVGGTFAAASRSSRLRWGLSAACYPVAVLAWASCLAAPFAPQSPPWLLAMLVPFVLQVQMASRSLPWTALVTVCVLALIGLVETGPGQLTLAAVLGQFLLITPIGILLAAVMALLRRSAARTEKAQQASLQKTAVSRLNDVTEVELERTDALVHDTVLTTLLQAASAEQDEEAERAKRMAQNALRVLAHVNRTGQLGSAVRLRAAVSAHEHHLDPAVRSFEILLDDHRLEDLLLPSGAADAILGALAEAMNNSVRHANAHMRTVHLRPLGPDGVHIEIDDDGQGFDYPAAHGAGIQSRIILPLRGVEGRAELRSSTGRGTSVRLSWGSVSLADVRLLEGAEA